MSYAARLIHRLVIIRTPLDDSEENRDEYGHPIPGEPELTEVRGLVQPRSVREQAAINQAGAEMSDHVIFLERMDLRGADAIGLAGDDSVRYELVGPPRDFNFGTSPHLEVDAKLVRSRPREAVVGS